MSQSDHTLQSDSPRERITAQFDTLSAQLQQAARYVLAHPNEVALMSMRELACHAGVQPATMTRLAKVLGFSGYNEVRGHYTQMLRDREDGFVARAHRAHATTPRSGSDLAERMLQGVTAQLASLCTPETLEGLDQVASRLATARKVYVVGLRSCHVVAWQFHYVMSLLGERSVHLDGTAGTGGDMLIRATADDAMLAVSVHPYTQESLTLARMAKDKGVTLFSITDSEVSPLAVISERSLFCPTESESFFHTLAPALVLSEVLCALLAEADRPTTLQTLQRVDQHHLSLNTYATTLSKKA